MCGASGAGSYRQLLASSTTRRTYVLSSLGRSAYAMLPLLFLFTVRRASDSFAVAATAMSLVALTSLSMPVKSRLIDRHGQRSVLIPLGVGVALALVAATVMAAAEVTSPAAWWTVAAAQGLLAPPLGPAMRAQWRALAPSSTRTAYALDAVTEEVLWLLGPAWPDSCLPLAPLSKACSSSPRSFSSGRSAWHGPRFKERAPRLRWVS